MTLPYYTRIWDEDLGSVRIPFRNLQVAFAPQLMRISSERGFVTLNWDERYVVTGEFVGLARWGVKIRSRRLDGREINAMRNLLRRVTGR